MTRKLQPNPYSTEAPAFVARYESVATPRVHGSWLPLLPRTPGLALDVGAGSGRDAAWLAERGWEVVAVEPVAAMRDEARRLHPSARIRWLDGALPDLRALRADDRFDLVLLSAVWQHVPPTDRDRALRVLANLLKPAGLLVVTLRHGPRDPTRSAYPVDAGELAASARKLALDPVELPQPEAADAMGRSEICWTTCAFRRPEHRTDD